MVVARCGSDELYHQSLNQRESPKSKLWLRGPIRLLPLFIVDLLEFLTSNYRPNLSRVARPQTRDTLL